MIRQFLVFASTLALTFGATIEADAANSSTAGLTGQQVLKSLTGAVRANPADLTLRRRLVQALIEQGLTVQAAQQIQQVLSVEGTNIEDLTTLADAQRYSGDLRSAVTSYKRVLQSSPMNTRALIGLAYTYSTAGDSRTAMEICNTAISQTTDPISKHELQIARAKLHPTQAVASAGSIAN